MKLLYFNDRKGYTKHVSNKKINCNVYVDISCTYKKPNKISVNECIINSLKMEKLFKIVYVLFFLFNFRIEIFVYRFRRARIRREFGIQIQSEMQNKRGCCELCINVARCTYYHLKTSAHQIQ